MRQADQFYLWVYRWSCFLVYGEGAGRLMGAVISKEELGIVNVCFNLILRLTRKSKKRRGSEGSFKQRSRTMLCILFNVFIVQKKYGLNKWHFNFNQNTLKPSLLHSDLVHQLHRRGRHTARAAGPPCLLSLLDRAWSALGGWRLAETPAVVVGGSARRVCGERVRPMGRVKGHGGTAQANRHRFIDTRGRRRKKRSFSAHSGIVNEHRRAAEERVSEKHEINSTCITWRNSTTVYCI